MAKKKLEEIKSQIFLIASELQTLVENENMEENVRDDLEKVVDQLSLVCEESEQNHPGKSKAEVVNDLIADCKAASSDIDWVIQSSNLRDGFVEHLEDLSMNLTITARQLVDIKIKQTKSEKEEAVSGVKKTTLFDFDMKEAPAKAEKDSKGQTTLDSFSSDKK